MHPNTICEYIIQKARGEDRRDVWYDVFDLYWRAAFSGHFGDAQRLFQVYFDTVGPDFKINKHESDNVHNRCLATIWAHAPATKPSNVPAWVAIAAPFTIDEVPAYNIFRPEFYEQWPEDYSIPSYGILKPTHDPHAWRTSQDHWECAACARLLCRVPQGQVPDRAAIGEAFEAIDRLRTQLPCRKTDEPERLYSPPAQSELVTIVPDHIYLPFLLGLGLRDRAWSVFCGGQDPKHWLRLPALYEICLGEGRYLPLIGRDEAKSAVDNITAALISRKANGRFDPLKPLLDLEWPELLRRFSEAAFRCHAKAYTRLKNPPQKASDILFPSITPELLDEVEQRLGPLPSDLKEMVQVANGFRGPLHRLGRGLPGVEKFKIEACDAWYSNFLTDEDRGRPQPSSEALWAPIWVAYVGKGIETAYQHFICPPETWRKLVGDEHAADGEYRLQSQIAWAYRLDGPEGDAFRGVRHWIASETFDMERRLERWDRGDRGEETEAEEEGEEDEDEETDEDGEGGTDENEDEVMEE